MKTQMKALVATTLLLAATLTVPAYADIDDIRGMDEAKITLTEAINKAEKHAGGTAYEASYDNDSFKPAFEVEVTKDGKFFDVRIDGVSGEVLGMREDIND